MNFLEQIAFNYTSPEEKPNLREYCFVFPNRRGYLFFRQYLLEMLKTKRVDATPVFMPAFSNISAVISQLCPYNIIDPDEAVFVLYDEYRKLAGKVINPEDFHKDYFWEDVSEEWKKERSPFSYGTQPHHYERPEPLDYNDPANAPARPLGYDPSMEHVQDFRGETDNGNLMTFDKFRYWGEMLISDFDDIDSELADPHQLLGNVRKLEELTATDYLTDAQKEIITMFWGDNSIDFPTSSKGYGKGKGKDVQEPERFWRHMLKAENSDVTRKFRYLWELMEPLYYRFRRRLWTMGYFTRGMSYRYVAEMLKFDNDYPLPFNRYIFVGFNVLTKAEIQIFKSLRESGRADFYWDFDSEAFFKDEEKTIINIQNKATRFLVRNMRHFKSRYPLEPSKPWPKADNKDENQIEQETKNKKLEARFPEPDPENYDPNFKPTPDYEEYYDIPEERRKLTFEDLPPEDAVRKTLEKIEKGGKEKQKSESKKRKKGDPIRTMIGVSSAVGQVKVAQEFLRLLQEDGEVGKADNAIDTVVVVNDESLLIPLLHSIPDIFSRVNISLMMPTRHLPVASLVSELISMQLTIRNDKYFHEPVSNILAHPLTRAIDAEAAKNFTKEITQRRMFLIDSEEIRVKYPTLYPLFQPINTNVAMPEFDYLLNVLQFIIKTVEESPNRQEEEKNVAIIGDLRSQTKFLENIMEKVMHFRDLSLQYMVSMSRNTLLNLLERHILNDSVPVKGEPLVGLQVLSMLETRTLDFKNVIVLSMNESCYPRSNYGKSFIPEALRKGYGLSSIDDQESMYAYYFYRLLSRAKNFALIYDARIGNEGSGEMSRYLYQILKLQTIKGVIDQKIDMRAESNQGRKISIPKDPEKLKAFLKGGDRELSASALKIYKKCPLRFYLENIARWREPDEMLEYMDSSVYGTIIHDTLQDVYQWVTGVKPNKGQKINHNQGHRVSREILDDLADGQRTRTVEKILKHNINKVYNKLKDEDLDRDLHGEAKLVGRIMFEIIKTLFRQEKEFDFIAAEYKRIVELPINPDLTIRFKYIIDRLDMLDGKLRIIDYKTGKDEVKFSSLDIMFDTNRYDAIFQLLLYCNAFIEDAGLPKDYEIVPMIYKLTKTETDPTSKEGLALLKYNKEDLQNQHQNGLNEAFLEKFNEMIEGLFDCTKDFEQTDNEEHCTFCPFLRLCNRNPQKWN